MIGYEPLSIVIFAAAFFAGFYICKLLDRRRVEDLREEMDDLHTRLQGADTLLSEKAIRLWRDVEPIVGRSSDTGTGDSLEGKVGLRPDGMQISEEEPAGVRAKSTGSGPWASSAFRQKGRVTKVMGRESGVKPQKPALALHRTNRMASEAPVGTPKRPKSWPARKQTGITSPHEDRDKISKGIRGPRNLRRPLFFGMAAVLFTAFVLALLWQLEPQISHVLSTITQLTGKPSEQEVTTPEPDIGYDDRTEGEILPAPETTAQEHIDRAVEELEKGQFTAAMKLFEEVIIEEPSLGDGIALPYARALRGHASELIETDPEEARALVVKAIELDSKNAQAHFQLGKINNKLEIYPEAIEAYHTATILDPRFSDAFFNLGYLYAVTGDYSNAEGMFNRCIELAPSYLDEVYFNLAMVQRKQGKQRESKASLEMSLDTNPDNPLAKKYLQQLEE